MTAIWRGVAWGPFWTLQICPLLHCQEVIGRDPVRGTWLRFLRSSVYYRLLIQTEDF